MHPYSAEVLVALYIVLLVIDWRQTLTIARNPERWYETNPILGRHPSVLRVNVWFAIVLTAGLCAMALLPTFCLLIVAVGAVVEGYFVFNNFRLGIRP